MEVKDLNKYSAQIPLPWLAGTLIALLFNAGLMYQQFQDVKIIAIQVQPLMDKVTAINNRVDLISERISGVDRRIEGEDQDIRDHEHRIRRLEGRLPTTTAALPEQPRQTIRDHGQ